MDNDQNEDLRMVIFNDYNQYNRYGSRLFGINTNNGGMYIEGDATTYNNSVEEIYDWSYLANRFMFENQMQAITSNNGKRSW